MANFSVAECIFFLLPLYSHFSSFYCCSVAHANKQIEFCRQQFALKTNLQFTLSLVEAFWVFVFSHAMLVHITKWTEVRKLQILNWFFLFLHPPSPIVLKCNCKQVYIALCWHLVRVGRRAFIALWHCERNSSL